MRGGLPRTTPTEQIAHCRVVDIVTRSRTGKVPLSEEPGAMRRSNVLVPLDRTMQLPLALAGGLRTTFADVVSAPMPERLTALVHRLQDDCNERSGEERKWVKTNTESESAEAAANHEPMRRKSRWQPTTHTGQRHGSAYRSRSA